MTTDAIELICEKLGTTVETLVPAVISYGKHGCAIGIAVAIFLVVVGIVLILLGFMAEANGKDGFILWLVGGFTLLVGVPMLLIAIYDNHMWNAYQTIRAYETIFGWFGGSN